jgi:nucleoside 2-deoxyribosyltransferase
VGRVQHNDSISDLILAGLRAAQVVVADVTHQRNGVYFEGGFGMGLGRTVVWMCRDTDLANVHFDTRNYNHIVWNAHDDLRTKLRDRLRATLALPARLG